MIHMGTAIVYKAVVTLKGLGFGPNWHPDPGKSWPVRAGMPVPFDALVQLCGGTDAIENFSRPPWDRVEQLVHPHWKELKGETATDDVKRHFKCLLDSLEAGLYGREKRHFAVVALQRLNSEEDPFVSRQHAITNSTEKEKLQDGIEVLFRRVNAGGTPLAGEEMAYSLLKARWDEAYTLVDNIVQDQNVGYLMPPSSLVLAATRVALTELSDAHDKSHHDIAQPSVHNFRRWISEPAPAGKSFLDAIKDLLESISPKTEKSPGRFHTALTRFCGLALYRDEDQADPGLPRKLILSVSPLILHPIFYWLDQRRNDNNYALEESRLGLLRYLVFSLLGILDNAKASLYAFEVLRENDQAIFPDTKIYKRWLEPEPDRNGRHRDPVAFALPEPDKFKTPFNIEPADGLLRHWNALFGGDDATNPYREFRRRFWAAEGPNIRRRDLLLWFQRASLPFWFKDYNPMREDGADTPYDFDHILPRAHISESGKSLTNTNTGLE